MRKTILVGLTILAGALISVIPLPGARSGVTAFADGGGTYSSTDYEKSNTYIIPGSTNITFSSMTTRLPRLASIMITWKTPVTSTFSFDYVRDGYTNAVLTHTITGGKSILALFSADVYFKQGDTLMFTNTVNTTAQLTLNWR